LATPRRRRLRTRFHSPRESPGFLLWLVTNAWQRQLRAALDPVDLTHVQFVLLASLAWLSREGDTVTQVRLAQQARTDEMMTSQVVRALERKGLLRRGAYPADHRARGLQVTPRGLQLANKAVGLVERADARFFGAAGRDLPKLVAVLRSLSGG
jgi:MarR family transcriptional regulator, organic hydroperoxide resistance regulator